ncbi:MAG: nucleoside monophosphate kinase [Candidatus Sungbacteria bacterium]|nr:nucleoside monophosphate kinase [Candidatus Sungbacteria bacterium]
MSKRIHQKGRTFVFLGISGSGKGAQAAFLMKVLPQAVNISTGDGLRAIAKGKNFVARFVADVLKRGGLAPLWAVAYIWLEDFVWNLKGDEDIIFDGAPRRVDEAELMGDFMGDIGREPPVAIYLKLSERKALARLLKRGRHDDHRRAIRGRFQFFKINVQPVINYYRKRRRLVVIDGNQEVGEVWRDIKRALDLK